jgi:hypothetical protein
VVASIVDAARRYPESEAWKADLDIATATNRYNRYLEESKKYYGRAGHTFVQYEQILENPGYATNRLFAQLGLQKQEIQLDLRGIRKQIVRSDEGWKNNPDGEIKDTRLVKFNQIFDEEERKFIADRIVKMPFAQPPL